jgi:hypothetical protein
MLEAMLGQIRDGFASIRARRFVRNGPCRARRACSSAAWTSSRGSLELVKRCMQNAELRDRL